MRYNVLKIVEHLMHRTRREKILIAICVDFLLVCFAFWCAFFIRLETLWAFKDPMYFLQLTFVIFVSIPVFFKLGLYHTLLRFMSFHAVGAIGLGAAVSGIALEIFSTVTAVFMPRSVPFIYALLLFISMSSTRFIMRYLYTLLISRTAQHVILIGSETSCARLISTLLWSEKYRVCGIFNENLTQGTIIRGVRVYPFEWLDEFVKRFQPKYLVLADEHLTEVQKTYLIALMENHTIQVRKMPVAQQETMQYSSLEHSQHVTLKMLTNRDTIDGNQELMQAHLKGCSVLVTGAGGSIGSELCKQIIGYQPKCLVLFDVSEYALYKVQQTLEKMTPLCTIIPYLGNIQDIHKLDACMAHYQIKLVYHAAAYKHVYLVEENPIESIHNNILGTWNVAQAALKNNLNQCLLVSSDKAVRPSSLMGATKRVSELIIQHFAQKSKDCLFNSVRFGNVLESSGSVVPLFRDQIRAGGPVTVTHPDVERFFMTITEASQLVLQASALASENSEVFVLDMGKSVRIFDLAKKLIHLSGLTLRTQDTPQGDIEIVFTGLKPGEKLKEELFMSSKILKTSHPKIFCSIEKHIESSVLEPWLKQISQACQENNTTKVLELMQMHQDEIGYQIKTSQEQVESVSLLS